MRGKIVSVRQNMLSVGKDENIKEAFVGNLLKKKSGKLDQILSSGKEIFRKKTHPDAAEDLLEVFKMHPLESALVAAAVGVPSYSAGMELGKLVKRKPTREEFYGIEEEKKEEKPSFPVNDDIFIPKLSHEKIAFRGFGRFLFPGIRRGRTGPKPPPRGRAQTFKKRPSGEYVHPNNYGPFQKFYDSASPAAKDFANASWNLGKEYGPGVIGGAANLFGKGVSSLGRAGGRFMAPNVSTSGFSAPITFGERIRAALNLAGKENVSRRVRIGDQILQTPGQQSILSSAFHGLTGNRFVPDLSKNPAAAFKNYAVKDPQTGQVYFKDILTKPTAQYMENQAQQAQMMKALSGQVDKPSFMQSISETFKKDPMTMMMAAMMLPSVMGGIGSMMAPSPSPQGQYYY